MTADQTCSFKRGWRAWGLAWALGIMAMGGAVAETYPSKAITLVYPFATGGPDRVVRLVALKMQESMGQGVIVDNRPRGIGPGGHEHRPACRA